MLSVSFTRTTDLDVDLPVRITESRGKIEFELAGGLFLPAGVAALQAGVTQLIAGGQWFQLWKGEIVSINSPRVPEVHRAGVHRGSLVDQEAGPRHR